MSLTTRNVRVNGYPPLDVVLAHFDAIPILINALRLASLQDVLEAWDLARNAPRSQSVLQPISKASENILNADDALPVEA